MTRLLVLGANGMLGHKLLQRAAGRMDTTGALRSANRVAERLAAEAGAETIKGLDAADPDSVRRIVEESRPDVIVNCVGVIKQRPGAYDSIEAITVNSLFPARLAAISAEAGARLIQLSTDCVFSGERGHYSESDRPDPVDVYGRSKLLGEIVAPNVLVLRTSMIGREIGGYHSLLEWFLHQPPGATVKGYRRAIFSGLSTVALADEIIRVIVEHPRLEGLYHLSAEPIAKFDLLVLVKRAFGVDCEILPDADFHCDRSLVSERYRSETGFVPQSWESMVAGLAADNTQYN